MGLQILRVLKSCCSAQVGTPLTHRHFLRRHQGTYGPAIRAGQGTFPGPTTPIPGMTVMPYRQSEGCA